MSRLTCYTLRNCDASRRAVKWLAARGVDFAEKPIRETPPTRNELRAMLEAHGGELRRLCNTAGAEYRTLGLAQKLSRMTPEEALALLAGNGSLVKRPFLLGSGVALVGFDESAWSATFARA